MAGFDEEDGGASPSHKKGSRAGRREGRVKSKGGADGEPGAAIAGATLRMSSWPPNDQEVSTLPLKRQSLSLCFSIHQCIVLLHHPERCCFLKQEGCCHLTQSRVAP